MREAVEILGLFAETPLHPGTGSTTGVVDLPVQREKHTDFPTIQASSLKGAMREVAEQEERKEKNGTKDEVLPKTDIIFGPKGSEHAGALALTDARILAFPVRSLTNVFIWVTCPAVVSRLKRDAALLAGKFPDIAELPAFDALNDEGKIVSVVKDEEALVSKDSGLASGSKLVLEEMLFTVDASKSGDVAKLIDEICKFIPSGGAHQSVVAKMKKDLVVISDNDFAHIVKNATQVSARVVLNENKTSNNLWYEESLPPDTLFYTLLMAAKPRIDEERKKNNKTGINNATDVLKTLKAMVNGYLQVGGNETVGMGWCALRYYPQAATVKKEGADEQNN